MRQKNFFFFSVWSEVSQGSPCYSALDLEYAVTSPTQWSNAATDCQALSGGIGYILAEFTDNQAQYIAMKTEQSE